MFKVPNPCIEESRERQEADHLYHLGLVVMPEQTANAFRDVKFVCTGGTAGRMQEFAELCLEAFSVDGPVGVGLTDLCGPHARYVMYKAGPVLAVSHGMGNPSMSIMLHEVMKLLHYARGTSELKFIRIGTCGGLGVPAGTTVVTDKVFNGLHVQQYDQYILGRAVHRPALLDQKLTQDLVNCASETNLPFPVVLGNTLCADDFYEEQARTDGAFCEFTNADRVQYLHQCHDTYGIRNFEMESLAFAALTNLAGVKAAVVCVAFSNRLETDQNPVDVEKYVAEWTGRPLRLVATFIKRDWRESQHCKNGDEKITTATAPPSDESI